MSFSGAMSEIFKKQRDDVEKAQEKYGEDGAQAVRDHQNDITKTVKIIAKSVSTSKTLSGGDPLSMAFGLVKGAIQAGMSGPSDEEIEERIKAKKYKM